MEVEDISAPINTAKQTAVPGTETTEEGTATESTHAADDGVAAMETEDSAPTNTAMPNVEVNKISRVRGPSGRVGRVEVHVPTTLLEAVALLQATKSNCGAQMKRNVEYVVQLVPEDMKERVAGVVATAPWNSNSAGPFKKAMMDALKAMGLVPIM